MYPLRPALVIAREVGFPHKCASRVTIQMGQMSTQLTAVFGPYSNTMSTQLTTVFEPYYKRATI